MPIPQLRLVDERAPAHGASSDPVRQVFEHWVFMLGRSPARCKLGATRRPVIAAALTLYEVDALLLAVDGLAADPLEGCSERMREAMRELEWLFAKESRIEYYEERGMALRRRAEHRDAISAERTVPAAPVDQEAMQRCREHLRALAAELRGAS